MPTDEPKFAGFTKSGKPSSPRASSKLISLEEYLLTVMNRPMGMPASLSNRFMTSLSMPTAEPSTPAPTNAILASFNSPWTVPSSPKGPCNTGKITSRRPSFCSPENATNWSSCFPKTSARFSPLSGTSGNPDSTVGSSNREPSLRCHRPFLSIPINTTSYFFESIASMIFFADWRETSCSAERPPNSIPTRIFLAISFLLLQSRRLADWQLDHAGVLCVVIDLNVTGTRVFRRFFCNDSTGTIILLPKN